MRTRPPTRPRRRKPAALDRRQRQCNRVRRAVQSVNHRADGDQGKDFEAYASTALQGGAGLRWDAGMLRGIH